MIHLIELELPYLLRMIVTVEIIDFSIEIKKATVNGKVIELLDMQDEELIADIEEAIETIDDVTELSDVADFGNGTVNKH